jgi:hypothetical protein
MLPPKKQQSLLADRKFNRQIFLQRPATVIGITLK